MFFADWDFSFDQGFLISECHIGGFKLIKVLW